MVSRNQKTEEE